MSGLNPITSLESPVTLYVEYLMLSSQADLGDYITVYESIAESVPNFKF